VNEPEPDVAKKEKIGIDAVGSETILVVDDEEGVREVATQYLSARGYVVLAAESGTKALELAGAHAGPIHVLVTDAVMPGMNGPALAKTLLGQRPETKVLYMSGYAEDTSLLEDARERGEAFLQKPFGLDSLAERLRELLSK
jgi:CheY-like chemotaxis protein